MNLWQHALCRALHNSGKPRKWYSMIKKKSFDIVFLNPSHRRGRIGCLQVRAEATVITECVPQNKAED